VEFCHDYIVVTCMDIYYAQLFPEPSVSSVFRRLQGEKAFLTYSPLSPAADDDLFNLDGQLIDSFTEQSKDLALKSTECMFSMITGDLGRSIVGSSD